MRQANAGARPSRRALLALAAGAAAVASTKAVAQSRYPDRPLRLIAPFAPGGSTDLISRTLAQGLQEALGQSVVVENRPGAAGNLGANVVARAEPDGYTILLASSGIIASPALYKSLPYDLFTDLIPIAEVAGAPNIFVANTGAGINSLGEVIAQAKADAGKLNYATPGFGTTPHLAMELFKLRAGINVTHVAYAGGAPAMQAVLAGTCQLGSMALGNIHAQVKAGAYKALAVTGKERWHDLPDVPTVQESGYPEFDLETIYILMAPAKTPAAVAERLSRETLNLLNKPDVGKRLQDTGLAVLARGPDALKARIAREVPAYKDIVAKAGIPVN
jgi:tripartite-type tricarboxylate transporter receptor subunit TctC